MVDYFYRGYEANGIDAGMKILQPYIDDPNCLTSKRQEILRRLKGMETLVPGSKAPEISVTDAEGKPFQLSTFITQSKYILLLFWSADCEHCDQLTSSLYPWQQDPANADKLTVVAISLDETQTEIAAWKKKAAEFAGWKHLNAPEGVNSKVAYDYYVLATPVMILLDAKTKDVVALPVNFEEIKALMK
jgi:cytochrome oxidase Cu insertion factor (SCO1/SenC/PrrC family)